MNLKFKMGVFVIAGLLVQVDTLSAMTFTTREILPIVAVIDTGVDIDHPILKDQIWSNPGEMGKDRYGRDKSNNNIDDDENGYVDDIHGWNFLADNNNISDKIGHGTHIAGIIVSQSKNTTTGNSHAPVKLMILKFFDPGVTGEKVLIATAKAIQYATRMGANIINYSAGGRTSSPLEYQALLQARNSKIMVIAAAGNDHTDNDVLPFFPASYHLSNIVPVAATDADGKLLPTSNFGKLTVTNQAVGKDIWSTLPGGKMGKMTGTSQATAMVTAKIVAERFKTATLRKANEELEKLFLSENRMIREKSALVLKPRMNALAAAASTDQ